MEQNGLAHYSEQELQYELKRREDEKLEQQKIQRREKISLVIQNRQALSRFMNHDRSSCENTHNNVYDSRNGVAECNLCCLADLYEGQDDVDVSVHVQLTKVS